MTPSRSLAIPATLLLIALIGVDVKAQEADVAPVVHSGSSIRASLLYSSLGRAGGDPWTAGDEIRDPWLGFDKFQHAAFGFLVTVGSQYVLVNKAGLSEGESIPLSVSAALTVGLAKELYDRSHGSGLFSHRDLVADAVGVALATGLILL